MADKLVQYARLIIRVGINVQRGRPVVISSPVECAYFTRILATEAYAAGASDVSVRWSDDFLVRERFLKADSAVFDTYPEWSKNMFDTYAREQTSLIAIYATDPELLKDADPDRLRRENLSRSTALKDYSDKQMSNYFSWCVVSLPTSSWATKVFPNCSETESVEKLWDAIYMATRVAEGDPINNWNAHIERLDKWSKKLNDYNFRYLHYKNSLGTDLTVELPENHMWISAGETAQTGVEFVANIPTEEIFTLPKKDGVNGVAVASMPLCLNGNLVENFRLTFKDGKIVDVQAEKGLDHLKNELSLDEGASYLGEVALVPHNSPISNSGILFYNTLFDENAACHFAFGKAYPCFRDARTEKNEVFISRGMNDSLTHEDFMVGTSDLSIIGTTHSGDKITVFENGSFAF